MDTTTVPAEELLCDLFTGPIELTVPTADDRYSAKPSGTSDQGYAED